MTFRHSRGSSQPHESSRAGLEAARTLLLGFCLLSALSLLSGCASPGEPYERKPPEPAAIADLAAAQSGNDVVLTFMPPTETADHRTLSKPLTVEIYRRLQIASPVAPAPTAPASSPFGGSSLLVTIPPAVLVHYESHGVFRYEDTLQPADFPTPSGQLAQYMVRTSASPKKPSQDSNLVNLVVYPAPLPLADLKAEVTHAGIVLTWTPPQQALVGPAPPISGYAIYRGEAEPGASNGGPESIKLAAPLAKIGESQSPMYRDAQTEVDKTYVYSVRSLARFSGETLESSDSNLAAIVARDTFPPAAPQGLVVVPVPPRAGMPGSIDLSWSISPETDTAGYNVYRSEQPGVSGTRVNAQLLLTPAFRDMNAVPGRRYFYSVTAVDRSGNESSASEAVPGLLPGESSSIP